MLSANLPRCALLAATLGAVTLSGCYVPDHAGGYAAPCELRTAGGWQVRSSDSLQRMIGSNTINLSTRHLYYSREPADLVEVHAYGFRGAGEHEILLSTSDVYLEVGGTRVHPDGEVRESPFMQAHWQCGGKFPTPADLGRCGPAVLTFPKVIQRGQGFTLHLGSLRMDGASYEVPDIKYCYIPESTHWTTFHG